MKTTTRYMNDTEKLSLKYTIGLYIAACYPVSFPSIVREVNTQYIGAEKLTKDDIQLALNQMIGDKWIEYYEPETNMIYSINGNTSKVIDLPENKFEPL